MRLTYCGPLRSAPDPDTASNDPRAKAWQNPRHRSGQQAWGLGFGVWGLGFRVWGLGFGVWDLGFGV